MAKELMVGAGNANRRERRDTQAQPETPSQRWSRNYSEILQEVRGAQIGTQLLLVFLLTLAFTSRFDETTHVQRIIYVVGLVLGAAANCLLIAPAPFHRLVFRRRLEAQFVRASSRFALWGVTLLMLALNATLLLILDVAMGTKPAIWITVGTFMWFLTWWYAAPAWHRIGQKRRRQAATIAALAVASEKLRRGDERSAERVATPRAALPSSQPAQLAAVPEARLPMIPTPYPALTSAHQLGYPGGVLPVTTDGPSPRPGAATGPYRGAPHASGTAQHASGPVPSTSAPAPHTTGPLPRITGPIPQSTGPVPYNPTPYSTGSHLRPSGPIPRPTTSAPYGVATGSHPVVRPLPVPPPADEAEKGGQTVAFQGAAAAGPDSLLAAALARSEAQKRAARGRHHADSSLTPRPDLIGGVPQQGEGSGGMQHGRLGIVPQQGEGSGGMQHGRSDNGMQHGQFRVVPQQGEGSGGMQHGRLGIVPQQGEGSGGMQHGQLGAPGRPGQGSGGMQHGQAAGAPPQGLVLPSEIQPGAPAPDRRDAGAGTRLSATGREAGSALGPKFGPGWLSAPRPAGTPGPQADAAEAAAPQTGSPAAPQAAPATGPAAPHVTTGVVLPLPPAPATGVDKSADAGSLSVASTGTDAGASGATGEAVVVGTARVGVSAGSMEESPSGYPKSYPEGVV